MLFTYKNGKYLMQKVISRRTNLKIKIGSKVDGTGSGSCPVAGFGISGVESSGSATRVS
jgi:hypothetical protein